MEVLFILEKDEVQKIEWQNLEHILNAWRQETWSPGEDISKINA